MALLCYMQVIPRHRELPNPAGPLLAALKLSLIEAVNAAVSAASEAESGMAKAKQFTLPRARAKRNLAKNLRHTIYLAKAIFSPSKKYPSIIMVY